MRIMLLLRKPGDSTPQARRQQCHPDHLGSVEPVGGTLESESGGVADYTRGAAVGNVTSPLPGA